MPVFPLNPRRPVGQRGLNRWGVMSYVTSTAQGLFAGALAIAILAPDATIVAGAAPVAPQLLGMRQVVRSRTAPARAGWVASFGAIGPEGFAQTLSASTAVVVVSAPTANAAAGASGLAAGAQVIVVSAPNAAIEALGPPRPQLWGLRQVVRARAAIPRGTIGTPRLVFVSAPTASTTLAAGANTVVVSAPAATLSAGVSTQPAGAQIVVVSAPTATEVSGAVTRAAGTNTVVVSAPAATVGLATIRPAGAQAIAVSAPTANVSAGAVSRSAGTQAVAVSAPFAAIGSGTFRLAGTNTIAISAPTATRTVGVAVVPAGTLTVAVTAPTVRLLGATELPPLEQTLLVSRWAEKPLASRFPDKTIV